MAIHKKLLEFQKLGITIERDATNPHFRSSYSSLNEVLAKVKKPLNDLGVVIVQDVGSNEGQIGLWTRLLDTEKDETENPTITGVTSFVPFIGAADMQKLGGAISYARRYSLIALLGLEAEDDDGNAAVGAKAAPRASQSPTGPVQMDSAPDLTIEPDFNL